MPDHVRKKPKPKPKTKKQENLIKWKNKNKKHQKQQQQQQTNKQTNLLPETLKYTYTGKLNEAYVLKYPPTVPTYLCCVHTTI